MIKPKIFFSHSSLDKEYISYLKQSILEKTSNTVDIFQSSDGESIPFGNNWVHKVEESLNESKIMFVFISNKSINSNWIYFESGFAYSKGIKIIPIGISGVDVAMLKPPLNLLQGFNITGSDGLNNIITVLNREFKSSFPEGFTEIDFNNLNFEDNKNSEYFECIKQISLRFNSTLKIENERYKIKHNFVDLIENLLEKNGITYRLKDNIITSYGIRLSCADSMSDIAISIAIDPIKLKNYDHFISELIASVYNADILEKYWCNILLNDEYISETLDFKIASRIEDSDIEISNESTTLLSYKDINLNIEKTSSINSIPYIRIIYPSKNFCSSTILESIHILINKEVIKKKEINRKH